jgi:flavin-dependent dehydrogenase
VLIVTDKPKEIPPAVLPLESVHPGISTLLDKLKIPGAIHIASRATYHGVQTGNKKVLLGKDEQGTWVGDHIDRTRFDEELLKQAIQRGVQLMEGETVSQFIEKKNWVVGLKTRSGRVLYARYLIDASGHKRIAGKKLEFREQFYSPPLVSWTGIASGLNKGHKLFKNGFAKFIPQPTGWTWLAPEPLHLCTWTRLSIKGRQELVPPVELKGFESLGKIKVANMRWRIFRPLCREGMILCGDAAGILDPAAGQGILQALYSGIRAAITVSSIFEQPALENLHLAAYDEWFMEQYIRKAERLRDYYSDHKIRIFG